MSWAEAKNIKDTLADKMSDLSNATLRINVGQSYAGRKLMLKRYDKDYMEVTVDSQGTAEVSVQPRSRYELVDTLAANNTTSNVFFVGSGEYKEVKWAMVTEDGAEKTPVDDVASWIACAGVGHLYNYTTVAQVVKDTACLTALCNSVNAVKYMLRSQNIMNELVYDDVWLTTMGAADPHALYLVGIDPYVSSKLCDNATYWNKAVKLYTARPNVINVSSNDLEIVINGDKYVFSHASTNGANCAVFDGAAPASVWNLYPSGATPITVNYTFANRKFVPKIMRWWDGVSSSYADNERISLAGKNGNASFSTITTELGGASSGNQWRYNKLANSFTAFDALSFSISGFAHRPSSYNHAAVGEIEVYGVFKPLDM